MRLIPARCTADPGNAARIRAYCLAVVLPVVLAGCNLAPKAPTLVSSYVQAGAESGFEVVASYDMLGDLWEQHGGRTQVIHIYSDEGCRRVLLQFSNGRCLWLDLSRGRQPEELRPSGEILSANSGLTKAVARFEVGRHGLLGDVEPHISRLAVPDMDRTNYVSYAGDRLETVSSHPEFDGWWEAGAVAEEGLICVRMQDGRHDGGFEIARSKPDAAGGVQLACTSRGNLFYATDVAPDILYRDHALESYRAIARAGTGDFRLAADRGLEEVCWVYEQPQSASAGSGRSGKGSRPGRVRCISNSGEALAALDTGSIPFDIVAGNWANRRCLLLQDSIGLALLDFRAGTLSWILRVSGDTPLFLSESGDRLFALVRDAVVQIEIDSLLRLAPQLQAATALSSRDTAVLKLAVEAFGWHWDDVTISPLLEFSDGITLFDTGDPESTWSEIEWSFGDNRASSLLIARQPRTTDLAALELDEAGIDAWCRRTAGKLGWPSAARSAGLRELGELHYNLALEPDAVPPLAAGEFEVWITDGAAFYSLEGATLEFPEQAIPLETVRRTAAGACVVADGQALLVQDVPEAGWVSTGPLGPLDFHPSPVDGAGACFRVECIAEGTPASLYVVLIDAMDGAVLDVSRAEFSPLANIRLHRGRYSPVSGG